MELDALFGPTAKTPAIIVKPGTSIVNGKAVMVAALPLPSVHFPLDRRTITLPPNARFIILDGQTIWKNCEFYYVPTHQISTRGEYRSKYVKQGETNYEPYMPNTVDYAEVRMHRYNPDYTEAVVTKYVHVASCLTFLEAHNAPSQKGKTLEEFLKTHTVHHRDFDKSNNQIYNLLITPNGGRLDQRQWNSQLEALANPALYAAYLNEISGLDINQFRKDASTSDEFTPYINLGWPELIDIWMQIDNAFKEAGIVLYKPYTSKYHVDV